MLASEKETIITYNEADDTAQVFTYHKALINKIEKLRAKDQRIVLLREGDGYKEYSLPKKAVRVQLSRPLSEEERAKYADRMRKNRRDV